jgi:hypothetical protein
MKGSVRMIQELWVKKVENPTKKPLNIWRDELYGYWMVTTDSERVDGTEMVVAQYYGTDKERILDIWDELCQNSENPTVGYFFNKKSKLAGGAFIAKADS